MKQCVLFITILITWQPNLRGQVITIGSTGDYPNLEAAEGFIEAGDTLILQSQIFSDGTQFLYNKNGTPSAPIVIMAQEQHQTLFRGGTEAIHLVNCTHLEINGLIIEQQTGNGINIDDGGDYNTPSSHITIRNCIFRDMATNGNNDLLKMSGVDSFRIEQCQFINGGDGGSGIDFVGCHWGTIQDCYFDDPGTSGIQNKGGTRFIRIRRNTFKNVAQRALNLGGSTGLQFFRPPLPSPISDAFEASDIDVYSNIFTGSLAPIAYVGSTRVRVFNNTFFQPDKWVIRILQETTTPGFLPCRENEFRNNIIYLPADITEVNIGPNTEPESFTFSNNLWFSASNSGNWTPTLPVTDVDQIIADPLFEDAFNENFRISMESPAVGAGFMLNENISDFDQNAFLMPPSIGAFEGGEIISSIESINRKIPIHVYPNPAGDLIHIDADLPHASLKILNQDGKIMHMQKNIVLPYAADLSAYREGLYFIQLENTKTKEVYITEFIKL